MRSVQEVWNDLCEDEYENPHWRQVRYEDIEALVNRIAELEEFAEWVAKAPVESGCCCCGTAMMDHTGYENHGPVDQWDYSLGKQLEKLGLRS